MFVSFVCTLCRRRNAVDVLLTLLLLLWPCISCISYLHRSIKIVIQVNFKSKNINKCHPFSHIVSFLYVCAFIYCQLSFRFHFRWMQSYWKCNYMDNTTIRLYISKQTYIHTHAHAYTRSHAFMVYDKHSGKKVAQANGTECKYHQVFAASHFATHVWQLKWVVCLLQPMLMMLFAIHTFRFSSKNYYIGVRNSWVKCQIDSLTFILFQCEWFLAIPVHQYQYQIALVTFNKWVLPFFFWNILIWSH